MQSQHGAGGPLGALLNLLGFAAIAMPNSLTDPSSDRKLTFSVASHKFG